MKLNFVLDGIGWIVITVDNYSDKIHYFFDASYISEPIIDLVENTIKLIPSCISEDDLKANVEFSILGEPAVDKWIIQKIDSDNIRLVIKNMAYEDNGNDKIVVDETCLLNDFIKEIVNSLESILKTYGFVGYKNTWCGADFPISGYLKLKSYLEYGQCIQTVKAVNQYGTGVNIGNIKEEINIINDGIEKLS